MAGTFIWLPPSGGGGGSAFYGDPVATFASLPATGADYEVRFVEDEAAFYYYDPNTMTWLPTTISSIININSDTTGTLNVNRGGTGSSAALVGGKLMQSNGGGTAIVESTVTPLDVTTLQSDVSGLQTDVNDLQTDVDDLQLDMTQAQDDIIDLQTDKVDKVAATDNALARFDGTTGAIQNGTVTESDTGELKLVRSLGLTGITTVARDALTPTNGMIVYNSDVDRFQGYFAGAWASLHGWGD